MTRQTDLKVADRPGFEATKMLILIITIMAAPCGSGRQTDRSVSKLGRGLVGWCLAALSDTGVARAAAIRHCAVLRLMLTLTHH